MSAIREPRVGWSEAVSLGDLLLRQSIRTPDATALILPRERYSYAELAERAQSLAKGLIGAGVRRGDHVGMLLPSGVEALATIFGVALTGAVLVPINTRFRTSELRHIVQSGDLAAIVTADPRGTHFDFLDLLRRTLPELAEAESPQLSVAEAPRLRSVVVLGGESDGPFIGEAEFVQLADGVGEESFEQRRAGVALRDLALMLFTSGTTAAPRGCLITHEGLVRNWTTVGRRLRMSSADRCWNPLPLFHIGGIGVTLLTLSHGGQMLCDTHFDADVAVEMIAAERPTVLYPVFPPIMMALINHPRFADLELGQVRAMSTVGDPALIRQVQAAIPGAVHVTTYGLTETTGITTYHDVEVPLEVRMTTAGSPQPGVEVGIFEPDTGERLGPGRSGEIRVRGWNVFIGYYGNPERTAAAFDAEGRLRTGDQGSLDPAGYLHFEGRLDEMIKVGGENVSPAEIEAFLGGHPAVHLAQVIGVPDPRLGEVAVAFVELKPGADADADQLLGYCDGQIARFKVPRHVRFIDDWPMSATKVRKADLREQILAELGDGIGAGR